MNKLNITLFIIILIGIGLIYIGLNQSEQTEIKPQTIKYNSLSEVLKDIKIAHIEIDTKTLVNYEK